MKNRNFVFVLLAIGIGNGISGYMYGCLYQSAKATDTKQIVTAKEMDAETLPSAVMDSDQDGDIDLFDYAVFTQAFTGPYATTTPTLTAKWTTDEFGYACVSIIVEGLNVNQYVVGGQFFLTYDPDELVFVSASPGDHQEPGITHCDMLGSSPYHLELREVVLEDEGMIDYMVGVPYGHRGSVDYNIMATFEFRRLTHNRPHVCWNLEHTPENPGPPDGPPPIRLGIYGGRPVLPLKLVDNCY